MTKPTRDMRPVVRPTRKMPEEVLRELLRESRPEDEERIREWEADERG